MVVGGGGWWVVVVVVVVVMVVVMVVMIPKLVRVRPSKHTGVHPRSQYGRPVQPRTTVVKPALPFQPRAGGHTPGPRGARQLSAAGPSDPEVFPPQLDIDARPRVTPRPVVLLLLSPPRQARGLDKAHVRNAAHQCVPDASMALLVMQHPCATHLSATQKGQMFRFQQFFFFHVSK